MLRPHRYTRNYMILLWIMARPEGFEPPTNRFEADYSIQLSYGRAVKRIVR